MKARGVGRLQAKLDCGLTLDHYAVQYAGLHDFVGFYERIALSQPDALSAYCALKRDYRYHFVLKSASREKLNRLLTSMLIYALQQYIPRIQVFVDVDAVWLM